MNLSSKLQKLLEGLRIFELLHDDEKAIFPLFALCFDVTSDATLEQQSEYKKNLIAGIILELLDYDVDETSDIKNYVGTGKLKYEMYKLGDIEVLDWVAKQLGEEKRHVTFRELYDEHLLAKYKKIAENSREVMELLHDTAPEIFENNFHHLINRYNWTELEMEYQNDKKRHTVTMEWLQEKQERELQKVLEMDVMEPADEPSTQAIEDSDYPYHRSFLPHKYKDNTDYQEAYTQFMKYATRQEGMIIPKLGEYCRYIAIHIKDFRPEQKKALFAIIKKLELIHADMVRINPELGKYLGITNDEGIEGTRYFAIYIHLLKIFEQPWFNEFRSDKRYTLKWVEQFLDDLLRSEWRDEIADEWRKPDKKKTVLGYIIGCLITAGVLKGSDYDIASAMVKYIKFDNKEIDVKAFATYFGKGRKTGYFEWICEYVKP